MADVKVFIPIWMKTMSLYDIDNKTLDVNVIKKRLENMDSWACMNFYIKSMVDNGLITQSSENKSMLSVTTKGEQISRICKELIVQMNGGK